jgi:hypothetical protein
VCVRRLFCCAHNKTDGTTAKNTNQEQNIDEEMGVKTVQAAPLLTVPSKRQLRAACADILKGNKYHVDDDQTLMVRYCVHQR